MGEGPKIVIYDRRPRKIPTIRYNPLNKEKNSSHNQSHSQGEKYYNILPFPIPCKEFFKVTICYISLNYRSFTWII